MIRNIFKLSKQKVNEEDENLIKVNLAIADPAAIDARLLH